MYKSHYYFHFRTVRWVECFCVKEMNWGWNGDDTEGSGYFLLHDCACPDSGGRVVEGVGLRVLACWECGFEFRRGHVCLFWVLCVRWVESSDGPIPRPEESYQVCVWVCVYCVCCECVSCVCVCVCVVCVCVWVCVCCVCCVYECVCVCVIVIRRNRNLLHLLL